MQITVISAVQWGLYSLPGETRKLKLFQKPGNGKSTQASDGSLVWYCKASEWYFFTHKNNLKNNFENCGLPAPKRRVAKISSHIKPHAPLVCVLLHLLLSFSTCIYRTCWCQFTAGRNQRGCEAINCCSWGCCFSMVTPPHMTVHRHFPRAKQKVSFCRRVAECAETDWACQVPWWARDRSQKKNLLLQMLCLAILYALIKVHITFPYYIKPLF